MCPARGAGQGFRQPPPRPRPAAHELIGRRLKLYYEELQQQPLPERLAELLHELDRSSKDPDRRRRS
jgi:hypothetical protein